MIDVRPFDIARAPGSAIALIGAATLFLGFITPASATQTFGSLGNFDAVNDTGSTAHGFEIDLEGISSADVTDVFGGPGRGFPPTVERYGSPTITNTTFSDGHTGVAIVYGGVGEFNNATQSWNVGTPSGVYATPGESCWTGGSGYGPGTPCDHFGVGTSKTPTLTSYHWLTETAAHSPVLNNASANLPAPIQTVTPPPPPPPGQPAAQPKVQGQVAGPAPEDGKQFGVAEWVKVYTTQYEHPVALEDLVGGNGIVPQNPSETEVEWQLLQTELGVPGSGVLESPDQQAGGGAESVLRRYEFYQYVGQYDAEGQALSDVAVTGPGGNVGNFIGDQNLAVNLNGVLGAPSPEAGAGLLSLAFLVMAGLGARCTRLLEVN